MTSKHETRETRWTPAASILIGGVALVPLAFAPQLSLDPFNVPKLTVVGVILGIATLVTALSARRGGRSSGASILTPAALFAGPAVISWIASPFRAETLWGSYQTFLGLLPGLLIVSFAVVLALKASGRGVPIVTALVISGTVIAGYGFLQSMGLDPVTLYQDGLSSVAPTSTLGNTNFSGGLLAIVLPLTLFFWNSEGRLRVAALAATCLVGLTLILTLSQGAWAAAVGGIVVVAALGGNAARKIAGLTAGLALGVIGLALVGSVVLEGAGISVPTGGGGARERAMFWAGAVEMAIDRPLTGWGPDGYSLEMPLYRPAESYLDFPYHSPEDPHSVPLAALANSGVLGIAGWAGLWIWVAARIRRRASEPLVAAVAGALAAYWLQSLVSVDQPPLRFAFWVLIAALAAATADERNAPPPAPRLPDPLRRATVVAAAVLLLVGSSLFALADLRAGSATRATGEGALARGRRALEGALELREEVQYRKLLIARVAAELLTSREPAILPPMAAAFGGLDSSPRSDVHLMYGRLLHYIGPDDAGVLDEALLRLDRAIARDPNNPLLEIERADVLITSGDPGRAIEILEDLRRELDRVGEVYAEYWPVMSVARLAEGDVTGATDALRSAERHYEDECRTTAAAELIEARETGHEPDSSRLLTLNIRCDAEYYNLFLHRLPPAKRSLYV